MNIVEYHILEIFLSKYNLSVTLKSIIPNLFRFMANSIIHNAKAELLKISSYFRWSGFLLCAIAMLLVILPMFTFPKKLPPRHKKKKKKKMKNSDISSDDEIMKEKENSKSQVDNEVPASMGFGKNVKGKRYFEWHCFIYSLPFLLRLKKNNIHTHTHTEYFF